MMPKQSEMELPLLKALAELGGRGTPQQIYPLVTKQFPNLSEVDLTESLATGGNKWKNRIQWVRQKLIAAGELHSPERGVWEISPNGRKRLDTHSPSEGTWLSAIEHYNLEEVADSYVAAFKEKVIQKLQDLSPQQFERFAGTILAAYGFLSIKITGRTGDGGIDGHGRLKLGLAAMNVAFQCKRWQGTVGRPEIDKFRGAIQGEFEQGVFFSTSDFSSQAREASIKKGAAPIILLNGQEIVALMIEKEIGVRRRPIEIYEDQIETLFEQEKA